MAVNIKGKEPETEKFRMKSKTNTIQYFTTEQAVQTMLQAGMDKQIMANNMASPYEINREAINETGIKLNDYRHQDRISLVETGRRADEAIRTEIQNSQKSQRNSNRAKNSGTNSGTGGVREVEN